jgi:hypothetical protein
MNQNNERLDLILWRRRFFFFKKKIMKWDLFTSLPLNHNIFQLKRHEKILIEMSREEKLLNPREIDIFWWRFLLFLENKTFVTQTRESREGEEAFSQTKRLDERIDGNSIIKHSSQKLEQNREQDCSSCLENIKGTAIKLFKRRRRMRLKLNQGWLFFASILWYFCLSSVLCSWNREINRLWCSLWRERFLEDWTVRPKESLLLTQEEDTLFFTEKI